MKHPRTFSAAMLLVSISLLSHASCSVKKSGIRESGVRYYSDIRYNDFGAPEFHGLLDKRPEETGKQYCAVIFISDLPGRYYNIGIVKTEEWPDYKRPFRVIHHWTGKGFELGYENTRELIGNSARLAGKTKDKEYSALLAGPGMAVGGAVFIASGVGGFAVGVRESLYASLEEFRKLGIRKRELILGYTAIEYDELNRIIKCSSFSPLPDEARLSETRFYYKGDEKNPRKTVSYSYPEKKTRVVYIRK